MVRDWTGEITGVIEDVVYSGWYWGDEHCKTRCQEKFTYREFIVDPLPPMTDALFLVRTKTGETVKCYSTGTFLVELEPVIETETKYRPTLFEKLKARFFNNKKQK